MTDDIDAQWKRFKAETIKRNANRHLALYLRERNGLLIWKAYLEYRSAGMPVPDSLLRKLDEWARAVLRASSEREATAALDLVDAHGRFARRPLDEAERTRDLLEDSAAREAGPGGQSRMAALRAAAESQGFTFGSAKTRKSRWLKTVTAPKKVAGIELHSVWLLKKRR